MVSAGSKVVTASCEMEGGISRPFLQQLWLSAPSPVTHQGLAFGFLVSCKAQELGQAILLTTGAGMWDPQLSLYSFLKGHELLLLALPKV